MLIGSCVSALAMKSISVIGAKRCKTVCRSRNMGKGRLVGRDNEKTRPRCFGHLETVFPMGDDGLRHSPESCSVCYCKVTCFQAAVASADGIVVAEEKIDRDYASGMIGFASRWSRRKTLSQRRHCQTEPTGHGWRLPWKRRERGK